MKKVEEGLCISLFFTMGRTPQLSGDMFVWSMNSTGCVILHIAPLRKFLPLTRLIHKKDVSNEVSVKKAFHFLQRLF